MKMLMSVVGTFGSGRADGRCPLLAEDRKSLMRAQTSENDPTRTSRVDARSCATGPGRCHLRQSGPCDYRSQVRNKVLGSSLSQRRG
jgi:hypothetical protein